MPQDMFTQLIQAENRNRELLRLLESIKPTDLRDQFAGAALTGLCGNSSMTNTTWPETVETAYSIADAMLKAREES